MIILRHICFTFLLITFGIAQDVKETRLANGIKYSMKGDFLTAKNEFEQALQLDPQFEMAGENLKFIKDILNRNAPKEIGIYLFQAFHYAKNNNMDAALTIINEGLNTNPGFSVLFNFRGFIYLNKGFYEKALSDFNRAIETDPNFALAYFNRGCIYEEYNLFENAVSDYTKSIQLNPNQASAFYNRGLIYAAQKSYDLAIDDFNRALQLNPVFDKAYNDRGIVLASLGYYDEAVSDFDRAIEINPGNALAYFNRGNFNFEQNLYESAISDFSKTIEIDPNNAEAYYNRANVYATKGFIEKAIVDFTQAVDVDPDFALAYYNKAVLLEKNRLENEAARNYFLFIQSKSPKDADYVVIAKQRIKKLQNIIMHLSVIIIKSESLAIDVYKKLETGKYFGELARQFSTGPEKENDGDIGCFSPEDLRGELAITAVQLEVGQHSTPIKTDSGYFILMKTGEMIMEINGKELPCH